MPFRPFILQIEPALDFCQGTFLRQWEPTHVVVAPFEYFGGQENGRRTLGDVLREGNERRSGIRGGLRAGQDYFARFEFARRERPRLDLMLGQPFDTSASSPQSTTSVSTGGIRPGSST